MFKAYFSSLKTARLYKTKCWFWAYKSDTYPHWSSSRLCMYLTHRPLVFCFTLTDLNATLFKNEMSLFEEGEKAHRGKELSLWIRWVNIVYYRWSFIHHKLLFVTYMFCYSNNSRKRIQWSICTMHFKWSEEDWGVQFLWFEAILK